MAHSPNQNNTQLPVPLSLPVRPRVVHQAPVQRQENADKSPAAADAAVIARARLQPLSYPVSSSSTNDPRRSTTTDHHKRPPHASSANGVSGDQLLSPATAGPSSIRPKPVAVSASSTPGLIIRLPPSRPAVISGGQTPSTTVKAKRWSHSSANKAAIAVQRPILPKATQLPPVAIPAISNTRLGLPPKRLPAANSNAPITSGNWPGISLSSGRETIFVVDEHGRLGVKPAQSTVGVVRNVLPADRKLPRRDFMETFPSAPPASSPSGVAVRAPIRIVREWSATLRGPLPFGQKFERLMKQAKQALSTRCMAQGGDAPPDYFTKEMILVDALESLIAKVAADELQAVAKQAARAPPDPVEVAQRDILELNAAEKDDNMFVTSPTDVTFLLNRVAEHHRVAKCDAAKWSVVAMARRGHCMDLTLDCLHKRHKRIKWTSSVPFLVNMNHTGRSVANDRIAVALKNSELNHKSYLKFCDLAGIGHLSERYLQMRDENLDQLMKRKEELQERLDFAIAKKTAARAARVTYASVPARSSAAQRAASTSASVSTAAIEVVGAHSDNIYAYGVKEECVEEDPESSPVGETDELNWSCQSSNSSVPVEFVEHLSMEFSDTQECPICRQLVEDIDFASHVEKCQRGSSGKRLAITTETAETATSAKKMRSDFDDDESDVKPSVSGL